MGKGGTLSLFVFIIISILIVLFSMAMGTLMLSKDCYLRYQNPIWSDFVNEEEIQKTEYREAISFKLRADANYSQPIDPRNPSEIPGVNDQYKTRYGEWINSGYYGESGANIQIKINGKTSLCRGYVTNYKNTSQRAKIARFDEVTYNPDGTSTPVDYTYLVLDWRSLSRDDKAKAMEVFLGDKVEIQLVPSIVGYPSDSPTLLSFKDPFSTSILSVNGNDCKSGKKDYSPLCGIATYWDGDNINPFPESNGSNKWFTNGQRLFLGVDDIIGISSDKIPAIYKDKLIGIDGLGTQIVMPDGKTYIIESNALKIPGQNTSDEVNTIIQANNSDSKNISNWIIFTSDSFTRSIKSDILFRSEDYSNSRDDNPGGYVIKMKQNKCNRDSGTYFTDTYTDRGRIDILILDESQTPEKNASPTLSLTPDNGMQILQVPKNGYLWFKINNAEEDYQDSIGSYTVSISDAVVTGVLISSFFDKIFVNFKDFMYSNSSNIFQKMTCYKSDQEKCFPFFSYVRVILFFYIMIFGGKMMLGLQPLDKQSLVIFFTRVILIGGLMNESTFEFFNQNIFGILTQGTDYMIASMSYDSLLTTDISGNKSVTPFKFLDAIFQRIFLDPTFIAQVLSLLSLGVFGIFYIIIVLIAIFIYLSAVFKGLSIYLIAFFGINILVSLTPLMLTFIAFETTKSIFDSWVNAIFRYFIEPVIVFAGLTIFSALFTIFLDYALGFSVCWRCAIAFRIPFIDMIGIPSALSQLNFMCISWFVPWGNEPGSVFMLIPDIHNYIIMYILAVAAKNYVNVCGNITSVITGSYAPSASGMGTQMASNISSYTLSKVGLNADVRNQIKMQLLDRGKKSSLLLGRYIRNGALDAMDKMSKHFSPLTKDLESLGQKVSDVKDITSQKFNDSKNAILNRSNSKFLNKNAEEIQSKFGKLDPDQARNLNNLLSQYDKAVVEGGDKNKILENFMTESKKENMGSLSNLLSKRESALKTYIKSEKDFEKLSKLKFKEGMPNTEKTNDTEQKLEQKVPKQKKNDGLLTNIVKSIPGGIGDSALGLLKTMRDNPLRTLGIIAVALSFPIGMIALVNVAGVYMTTQTLSRAYDRGREKSISSDKTENEATEKSSEYTPFSSTQYERAEILAENINTHSTQQVSTLLKEITSDSYDLISKASHQMSISEDVTKTVLRSKPTGFAEKYYKKIENALDIPENSDLPKKTASFVEKNLASAKKIGMIFVAAQSLPLFLLARKLHKNYKEEEYYSQDNKEPLVTEAETTEEIKTSFSLRSAAEATWTGAKFIGGGVLGGTVGCFKGALKVTPNLFDWVGNVFSGTISGAAEGAMRQVRDKKDDEQKLKK